MKVAEIVNFQSSTDAPPVELTPITPHPDDVRLLIARFLECNNQYMLGLLPALSSERFCNDTIMSHLAEQGLQEEAEYETYVQALLHMLAECRADYRLVAGLNPRNSHVLDRMISRLQMELIPTPEFSAKQFRSVMTHDGVPYKLDEFITMSKGSAYVRWHWGDMIALAEAKGGHALRVAKRLQQALDGLEDSAAEPEVDVMALAMGQF
jgi:hypothetical protein